MKLFLEFVVVCVLSLGEGAILHDWWLMKNHLETPKKAK